MRHTIDTNLQQEIEAKSRDLAFSARKIVNAGPGLTYSDATLPYRFCLMIFATDGPEIAYTSNATQGEAIQAMERWIARERAATREV